MFEGTEQERIDKDDGLRAICGILIGTAIGLGIWLVIGLLLALSGFCWLF